jgi:hypothetical protein
MFAKQPEANACNGVVSAAAPAAIAAAAADVDSDRMLDYAPLN